MLSSNVAVLFCLPTSDKWELLVPYIGEGTGTPLQYFCLENSMDGGAWWAAVHGVAKSWARLSEFTFTFHFHALEKEMATHSSVLAWRMPGTAEPGGLPSMGSHRVGHNWSDLVAAAAAAVSLIHLACQSNSSLSAKASDQLNCFLRALPFPSMNKGSWEGFGFFNIKKYFLTHIYTDIKNRCVCMCITCKYIYTHTYEHAHTHT